MSILTRLLAAACVSGAIYACVEHPEKVSATLKKVENGIENFQAITENTFSPKEARAEGNGKQRNLEIPERMKGTPERMVTHCGYTLSFNREHNNPNWVAWELTAQETEGTKPRAKDFLPDPDIPEPHRVTTDDYKGSGYDRGHMAPAADMKWSAQAMKECFYMSNMCPQDGSLNSGAWSTLEKACRRWAKQEGKIYIVTGPVYKKKKVKKIGKEHRVSVPDGFFKVVLSTRKGHEKAIGFYYGNHDGKQSMTKTAITVDEAERISGINFFVNLPDPLEEKLESACALKKWK